jgi:hypothetical protein
MSNHLFEMLIPKRPVSHQAKSRENVLHPLKGIPPGTVTVREASGVEVRRMKIQDFDSRSFTCVMSIQQT